MRWKEIVRLKTSVKRSIFAAGGPDFEFGGRRGPEWQL